MSSGTMGNHKLSIDTTLTPCKLLLESNIKTLSQAAA
jgi:hypothetical protein